MRVSVSERKNNKKASSRTFLGKTENFINKQEAHFYQRMLKAYLAGKEYFNYGIDPETGMPQARLVLQSK